MLKCSKLWVTEISFRNEFCTIQSDTGIFYLCGIIATSAFISYSKRNNATKEQFAYRLNLNAKGNNSESLATISAVPLKISEILIQKLKV